IPKNMPLPANGFSIEAKLTELSPRPASILQWDILPCDAVAEPWVDGIKIKGDFNLSVLADTAEGIYSFDQAVPFEQDIELNSPAAEYSLQAQVFPIEVMPSLHSDGSITARIIASAKIDLCYKEEECFVADVAKRTPAQEALSEPTLIYRFPQKGETLWDIAKSYKADPESILNANLDSFDENGALCLAAKPVIIKL
ncbi:MAG: LysM peptidoglycan-binding domain-containing protein, partial [Clostridia bacterium]|nr:LysM peptidoglycan-binding domain-containing protein [Clostridia bacterium]